MNLLSGISEVFTRSAERLVSKEGSPFQFLNSYILHKNDSTQILTPENAMPNSTYIGNVTKEMYKRERKRRSPPESCESRKKALIFFEGKRKEEEKWRDSTPNAFPDS